MIVNKTPEDSKVNITNCDREPIHIIGESQSHGVIVICSPSDFTITQCSNNVQQLLGKDIEELLGQPLQVLIGKVPLKQLQKNIEDNPSFLPENVFVNDREFTMIPHLSRENLILDFEEFNESVDPLFFQRQLSKILNELKETEGIQEMCQQAVSLVKRLYNYDRVMMYRFDEEWNGEVVAEVKEEDLEPWLGLHYPATDIPKPAREIFLKQGVRMISDVNYQPAKLEPQLSPITQKPVDLSKSELRGVSPIHIEYLQNMKVGASLTAAIILNGKLWGLLACHHYSPKYINYHQRQSCKFLTQVFSNQLALKTSKIFLEKNERSDEIRKKLVLQMFSVADLDRALCKFQPSFTDIVECSGGAAFIDGKLCLVGKTPSEKQVLKLIKNVLDNKEEKVFSTNNLSEMYPKASKYKDKASGILSIRIGEEREDYLIWFRPEEAQNVSWGGKPEKESYVKDGIEYLSPRESFEKWTQSVSGIALRWQKYDLQAVLNLRDSITHVLVKKQKDEIKELNNKLIEANKELETFSYSVSHDLRAPLRGIDGFARILKDYYSDHLDDYSRTAVNTIIKSAGEMDLLIKDILAYSKMGLSTVERKKISMQELVESIVSSQNPQSNYPKTHVVIDKDLPPIMGDRLMISQLISNLVGNALKYSAKSTNPEVNIGHTLQDGNTIYFVKDNGIGFNPAHTVKIFDAFTRLAGDEYSGSGVGLATAKKVVERHGGQIWVETVPQKGSTFFFSIPADI